MDARAVAAPRWFVIDGPDRHGPMSAGALTTTLHSLPDPGKALVWRDGLANWCEAASLPELWPSPPLAAAAPAAPEEDPVTALERTATVYRHVVLLIGGLIALGIGRAMVMAMLPPVLAFVAELGIEIAAIGLFVVLSVMVYRLAGRIDAGLPIGWALAIWIPLVNLAALIALSQKAQTWCARHGIAVGLLGPSKGSLDWMRD